MERLADQRGLNAPTVPGGLAKRIVDVIGALLLLLITLPVMFATMLAIRIVMGRPALFRQQRPGLGGEPFTLLKFRTMSEPVPGDAVASDAERLTGLGRFLRRWSLDELPELINVLRGDMSLVGPRPLLLEYLPLYTQLQARRHEVRPGITGLAQVRGRNALSWEERFELDVWYVDHRSWALDLRILAQTVGLVLAGRAVSHEGCATMPRFGGTGAHMRVKEKKDA